jgi:hypothetical protein
VTRDHDLRVRRVAERQDAAVAREDLPALDAVERRRVVLDDGAVVVEFLVDVVLGVEDECVTVEAPLVGRLP